MRNCAQIGIDDEIFVDSFAGGGGASTGMEVGLGITVAAAINHDPAAILMHKTNHPYTEHYQASVWDVDPRDVCRGRPVGGAWFSPDCKHFMSAKDCAYIFDVCAAGRVEDAREMLGRFVTAHAAK